MDQATLQQIPEQYRTIYTENWNTIKESVKEWRFKDVYHFPLMIADNQIILRYLRETLDKYRISVKINAAFGFILRNRVTNELKFFHPSNNTRVFDAPRIVRNPNDVKKLEDEFEREDILEYARLQRPSTKWIVERIICMKLEIFKLSSTLF